MLKQVSTLNGVWLGLKLVKPQVLRTKLAIFECGIQTRLNREWDKLIWSHQTAVMFCS